MLGISRTPVREALILLEHEGFVRTVPRHGVVVARKSRTQIADMVLVWSALEGMAARLAATLAEETVTTNSEGIYEASALPVSAYRMRVMASGFRLYTVERLTTQVARILVQDVHLELGEHVKKRHLADDSWRDGSRPRQCNEPRDHREPPWQPAHQRKQARDRGRAVDRHPGQWIRIVHLHNDRKNEHEQEERVGDFPGPAGPLSAHSGFRS